MQTVTILYPAIALVFLTFGVGLWLLRCRIRAYKEGLNPVHFRFNKGEELPAYALQAEQHYSNLFEMPLLFYVAVIFAYITQTVSWPLLVLAWVYVGARVAHAYIHLGSNKLRTRRDAFLFSFLCLLLMWLWLLGALIVR